MSTPAFLAREKVRSHPLGHSLLTSLPGSRGAVAGLRPDGTVVISDSGAAPVPGTAASADTANDEYRTRYRVVRPHPAPKRPCSLRSLTASHDGGLLCALGDTEAVVIDVPPLGSAPAGGETVSRCRQLSVPHCTGRASAPTVASCAWHPGAVRHVVILTTDGAVMVYDASTRGNGNSNNNRSSGGKRGGGGGGQTFPLQASLTIQLGSAGASLPRPVAMSFPSNPSLLGPWASHALYVGRSDGSVSVLCPVVPPGHASALSHALSVLKIASNNNNNNNGSSSSRSKGIDSDDEGDGKRGAFGFPSSAAANSGGALGLGLGGDVPLSGTQQSRAESHRLTEDASKGNAPGVESLARMNKGAAAWLAGEASAGGPDGNPSYVPMERVIFPGVAGVTPRGENRDAPAPLRRVCTSITVVDPPIGEGDPPTGEHAVLVAQSDGTVDVVLVAESPLPRWKPAPRDTLPPMSPVPACRPSPRVAFLADSVSLWGDDGGVQDKDRVQVEEGPVVLGSDPALPGVAVASHDHGVHVISAEHLVEHLTAGKGGEWPRAVVMGTHVTPRVFNKDGDGTGGNANRVLGWAVSSSRPTGGHTLAVASAGGALYGARVPRAFGTSPSTTASTSSTPGATATDTGSKPNPAAVSLTDGPVAEAQSILDSLRTLPVVVRDLPRPTAGPTVEDDGDMDDGGLSLLAALNEATPPLLEKTVPSLLRASLLLSSRLEQLRALADAGSGEHGEPARMAEAAAGLEAESRRLERKCEMARRGAQNLADRFANLAQLLADNGAESRAERRFAERVAAGANFAEGASGRIEEMKHMVNNLGKVSAPAPKRAPNDSQIDAIHRALVEETSEIRELQARMESLMRTVEQHDVSTTR